MIKLGHLKGGRDAFFVEADIEKLEHVADRAGPLTGRQLAAGSLHHQPITANCQRPSERQNAAAAGPNHGLMSRDPAPACRIGRTR